MNPKATLIEAQELSIISSLLNSIQHGYLFHRFSWLEVPRPHGSLNFLPRLVKLIYIFGFHFPWKNCTWTNYLCNGGKLHAWKNDLTVKPCFYVGEILSKRRFHISNLKGFGGFQSVEVRGEKNHKICQIM
jgi:hypothetical protein